MSKKKSSRSSASPSFFDQALSFVPKDMRKQVVKVTTEALKQTEKQRKVLEKDLAKLSKQAQQVRNDPSGRSFRALIGPSPAVSGAIGDSRELQRFFVPLQPVVDALRIRAALGLDHRLVGVTQRQYGRNAVPEACVHADLLPLVVELRPRW